MFQNKKIVVAGATGSIGTRLCKELKASGFEVVIYSRNPDRAKENVPYASKYVKFDYRTPDGWVNELDDKLGVINLSGAPIFKRWSSKYVKEIVDSRVKSTKAIVDGIRTAKNKPKFLINASAAGYYGYENTNDDIVTESYPPGHDFWGNLVVEWEKEAEKARELKVRVVTIRTSLVLSQGDGALEKLESVFRKNLGGYVKPGTQWFPWIHVQDEVSLVKFAMENPSVNGPLNASSPNIPNMKEFAMELGKAMNKRGSTAIPPFLLRIVIGKGASVISKGWKIYPKAALDYGFKFKFPELSSALGDLVKK